MGPDMIIVLCLALIFFGGIGFLVWKEHSGQKTNAAEFSASPQSNRKPIEKLGKKKL